MWVVAGGLSFGVITFGIRSRWFLDNRRHTSSARTMREARRAEVAGYGSREILRPECCLLTTPNQALTQSTRRLALSSSPWPCAHPPTRGPARRDFEPRIRNLLHRSRRPAPVLVSPIPHEPRSLPPLFALAPTKSSDSRSPRRPARSHLEDLPDSPTPSRDVPLSPAQRHPRPKSRARR